MKARVKGIAFVVVLALVVSAAACAHVNTALVAADKTIHDTLAKVDDEVRTWCEAHPGSKPACDDTKKPLLAAMDAGIAYNRGVRDQKITAWTDLLKAVADLGKALQKLPEGATAQWFKDLQAVVNAASAIGGK